MEVCLGMALYAWKKYLIKILQQLKEDRETENSITNLLLYEKDNKNNTPTSIFEMRLLTSKRQEKQMLKILECCRLHYNAVLGEALKRLNKIKEDPEYKKIIAIPKDTKENKKLRGDGFKMLNEKYGFTKASIQIWGTTSKNSSKFINKHAGVHVLQNLSDRAFAAVQKVALHKAKKVNFVKKGDYKSIRGKNNKTFLRFQGNKALISDMVIKCKVRKNDEFYKHFLRHEIKYCQLVVREIGNSYKFFIQIAYEGNPYPKVTLGEGKSCPDIGPSTIALCEKDKVSLERFCSEILFQYKVISKLQRKLSRKLRLANPQNFDEKGAIRKGKKTWNRSKTYLKLARKIADLNRRLAQTRRKLHGERINMIVSNCDTLAAEKLSYKAFQKLYGTSVAKTAPGQFMDRLKAKITNLGGAYIDIKTYHTKLSQTCICGHIAKKKLSERIHRCPQCGLVIQRDILSAFLGLYVPKSGKSVNLKKARKDFEAYKPLIDDCMKELKELKKANSNKICSTFGI